MKEFETVEVTHIPREQNTWADILSKLASRPTINGNKTVIQEVLNDPLHDQRERRFRLQGFFPRPSKSRRNNFFLRHGKPERARER